MDEINYAKAMEYANKEIENAVKRLQKLQAQGHEDKIRKMAYDAVFILGYKETLAILNRIHDEVVRLEKENS